MSKKNVWVIKGIGDDNPEKLELKGKETVGELRKQYAAEMGVSASNIELTTDTARLENDNVILAKVVDDGETINVLPRAKAGSF